MLKVIFTLDCDQCHQPFEHAIAATEADPQLETYKWIEAAEVLACLAEDSGWEMYPAAHICSACLVQVRQRLIDAKK